jgi:diguanylate cyclase (GGDEF)-like protein
MRHNLSEARKYKETISLLLADIDHFKQYNDAYGHLSGDETLKHLAETLTTNIRKEDSAARIGGEEFVIVLPGIEYNQALRFGERLRKVIQEDRRAPHPITVSMGVSTYEFSSKQTAIKQILRQMILEADQAMYHSKNTGRNKITHFFDLREITSKVK